MRLIIICFLFSSCGSMTLPLIAAIGAGTAKGMMVGTVAKNKRDIAELKGEKPEPIPTPNYHFNREQFIKRGDEK